MSEPNSEKNIYTWLAAQSLPVQVLLGLPVVFLGALYGTAVFAYVIFILILPKMIVDMPRQWAFRRSMKRDLRIVEWRHVRAQLLANPKEALLLEFKGDGYVWCCPHACCEHLPRYDAYLARGTSVFYDLGLDDHRKLKRDAAVQCLEKKRKAPAEGAARCDPERFPDSPGPRARHLRQHPAHCCA